MRWALLRLPWPTRHHRRRSIDAAKLRYEHALARRDLSCDLVEDLRAARERNHFREMFDDVLRRTG